MSPPAYMLSLLVRQHLLLRATFQSRHPSSWLVWEPGEWHPARTVKEGNARSTQSLAPRADGPVGNDPLCFELVHDAAPRDLSVGRSTENDLVVNDLTLSREHLVLHFEGGAWSVSVRETSNVATAIDDQAARVGAHYPLTSGTRIHAGDVRFTFYGLEGFLTRLEQEAKLAAAQR